MTSCSTLPPVGHSQQPLADAEITFRPTSLYPLATPIHSWFVNAAFAGGTGGGGAEDTPEGEQGDPETASAWENRSWAHAAHAASGEGVVKNGVPTEGLTGGGQEASGGGKQAGSSRGSAGGQGAGAEPHHPHMGPFLQDLQRKALLAGPSASSAAGSPPGSLGSSPAGSTDAKRAHGSKKTDAWGGVTATRHVPVTDACGGASGNGNPFMRVPPYAPTAGQMRAAAAAAGWQLGNGLHAAQVCDAARVHGLELKRAKLIHVATSPCLPVCDSILCQKLRLACLNRRRLTAQSLFYRAVQLGTPPKT